MRVALPMTDADQTERQHLVAAIAGDRRAFDALVALHEPRALRAAHGVLRDPEAARDVVQEAFVRTWQRLGTFDIGADFRPWLYCVVRNLAVDRLRAQRCRPADSLGDHECAHSPEDTETAFARRQAGAAIGSALDALSPDHREVIVLREVEGFSYEEIAERVECPLGTVMSRLHHARRRMQSLLRARMGDDLAI